MELITKTGKHIGIAELLYADGNNHYAFYTVYERRLLLGFIPFKKQVDSETFSFPQQSMSPHADGFVQHTRRARLTYFPHLNFI